MAKSAPAPTAPSISLASLKEMREKYLGGVQQLQQQLERTRSDLIATQGTVQFIEQQITELEKPATETAPEAKA